MAKNKSRRLWLELRSKTGNASKNFVASELIKCINRGDYNYKREHPRWRIALGWNNYEPIHKNDFKFGEFTKEMKRSRESSPGWDIAVIAYLESFIQS